MPTEAETPTEVEENSETLDFETWLGEQDEKVRTAYEAKTASLKSALDSERKTNKEREKELRTLAAQVEKGSEAEKRLTEMADREALALKKADFFQQAATSGIKNLPMAWKLVGDDEAMFRYGKLNLDAVRAAYPELFPNPARSHAGNGAAGADPVKPSIDNQIRAAFGRH